MSEDQKIEVSIIVPVHNAEEWIDECFNGILSQTFSGLKEVSIYNDRSTDKSEEMLNEWMEKLKVNGFHVVYSSNTEDKGGVGFAKNRAIEQSTGEYLCFQDADDVMYPERINRQYKVAKEFPNAIVGTYFERKPENSTRHYTAWMNQLTDSDLMKYQYREVLVIQPTWFMNRAVFDRVGGYKEDFSLIAYPEDLDFYHRHLDTGGLLKIVPEVLLMYRMHGDNTCWKIPRRTILRIKLAALQRRVLCHWDTFSVWGAGRDGRNFVNDLEPEFRKKVICFGDVDVNKIGTRYKNPLTDVDLPIVHFSELKPPVICCVAMGRTNGIFENNVASMNWVEGKDFCISIKMSNDLIWQIVKKNSCFIRKQQDGDNVAIFNAERMSVNNLYSRKNLSICNDKSVTVVPAANKKRLVVMTKNGKKSFKTVSGMSEKSHFRPELKNTLLKRYTRAQRNFVNKKSTMARRGNKCL
ncbi:hypothetical protein WA158_000968 [Blastocystis sp. Blastoise]